MADLDVLVSRIETIAADLDEMAFDQLREAVADGEVTRPANDKKLMQARRALEKAAGILRQLSDSSNDETGL